MTTNPTIYSTKLLAVEGKDEVSFFEALFEHLELKDIQILDMTGKDKFRKTLMALSTIENFENISRFGFIRDAETAKASSAFNSIRNVLSELILPAPSTIGEIVEKNECKTGIFIMPTNRDPGMLEDLCLGSIDSSLNICIDNYLECISKDWSESQLAQFERSKAKVQVYLAAKIPLVNSLGMGAKKHHWDLECQCFEPLKQFLIKLFV